MPERVPSAAWAMAWLFLVGQVVSLAVRGINSSDLPWVVLSMALSALVTWWFSVGVLRGRMVRLVIVFILLGLVALFGALAIVDGLLAGGGSSMSNGDLLTWAFTVAQLVALVAYCRTDYFTAQRAGREAPLAALAPLLWIAVAVGLLGGLSGQEGEQSTVFVRVGL